MQNRRLISLVALIVLILLSCNLLPAGSNPNIALTVLVVEVSATPATPGAPAYSEQSTAAPTATLDLGPPPSFEEITFPDGIESPEQHDGRWYLRDQPVALSYHLNTNGEKELWLTREDEPDWPVMIQSADGMWRAGAEDWDGNATFININDVSLNVTIYTIVEGGEREELLVEDLTPYETYNLASLPPSAYEFRFQFQADEAFDLNCAVKLRQDSRLTFAAVPVGVAVSEASFVPESGRDMDVRTSPLCGG